MTDKTHSDLCDGEVQTNVKDDCEEQDVERTNHQQRLLQHQDLIEGVVNLKRHTNIILVYVYIQ